MDFKLDRIQVWAVEIPDRPGGAAMVLESLAQAGANLEYIVSRRLPNRPGWGELYVAPITGPSQTRALQEVHGEREQERAGQAERELEPPAAGRVRGSLIHAGAAHDRIAPEAREPGRR